MQYQSECQEALKSVANIHKPFEKVFMDVMKLFMAIPDRINFLQLGRYGEFSEQTSSIETISRKTHLTGFHLMSNLSKSTCMVQERQLP